MQGQILLVVNSCIEDNVLLLLRITVDHAYRLCMNSHVHAYTRTPTHMVCAHRDTHLRTYITQPYIYLYMYYINLYTCTHTHTTQMYIHKHTHAHVHTHMHTHTHTKYTYTKHIHTYTQTTLTYSRILQVMPVTQMNQQHSSPFPVTILT